MPVESRPPLDDITTRDRSQPSAEVGQSDDERAVLAKAIEALTRRIASADDVEILRLVDERREMRARLLEIERAGLPTIEGARKRRGG